MTKLANWIINISLGLLLARACELIALWLLRFVA
jgi:hypothetical protein